MAGLPRTDDRADHDDREHHHDWDGDVDHGRGDAPRQRRRAQVVARRERLCGVARRSDTLQGGTHLPSRLGLAQVLGELRAESFAALLRSRSPALELL